MLFAPSAPAANNGAAAAAAMQRGDHQWEGGEACLPACLPACLLARSLARSLSVDVASGAGALSVSLSHSRTLHVDSALLA
jgi:hypothetical protein